MSGEPLVSVLMPTYNHEAYVAQAIESVLMQKAEFGFEIVIGEDCSTDGTRKVVESYANKYPDIIRATYQEKNIGASRNCYGVLLPKCARKYIAVLEGDDYWTDPEKLRRQVQFLETHSRHIGVAHNYVVVDKNGGALPDLGIRRYEDRDFTLREVTRGISPFNVNALLFRNIFSYEKNVGRGILFAHPFIGDLTLTMLLLEHGNIFVMKRRMSAYRFVSESAGTNFTSVYGARFSEKEKAVDLIRYYEKLENHLAAGRRYRFDYAKARVGFGLLLRAVKDPTKGAVQDLREVLGLLPAEARALMALYGAKRMLLWPYGAASAHCRAIFSSIFGRKPSVKA